MKIAVCQLGARLHYAAAERFHERGVLGRLYTDLYCSGPVLALARLLTWFPRTKAIGDRLGSRRSAALPEYLVKQFPLLGLQYAAKLRRAKSRDELSGIFLWANETFERKVLAAGFADCDTVFAFNTAAAEIFETARQRGIRCVLEQTIAPKEVEEELLRDEYQRAGIEWREDVFVRDIVARERREWALADLIVAGSPFVAASLARLGVASRKVAIVPYGVDRAPQTLAATDRSPFDGRRPLQVLFIGNDMIRKGVRYLIESVRGLGSGSISVNVVGRISDEERRWLGQAENVHFAGSIERPSVWRFLQESDVLVLPSLCEGSATATYEALAVGLPVICTENTGSIVTHGHDGYIVPPRDAGAITRCLQSLLDQPQLLEAMRANALMTAKSYTVETYGERLMAALSENRVSQI